MSLPKEPLSFDNTEYAFAYKSDKELARAHFLFSTMGKEWLVKMGLKITPWAIRSGLPVKGIIRDTLFKQFVGGETLEETALVAKKLAEYNVQVILDYGVEGGHNDESDFDHACEQFIKVIDYAATQPNIPFMSVKVTGLARFGLLEKLDKSIKMNYTTLWKRYPVALSELTAAETAEWQRVKDRLRKIFQRGAEKNIGVFIDAEESWIQDPVDIVTMEMMEEFNRDRAIVFNTFQMYRHDRFRFVKDCYQMAKERNFVLGAKMVRGAYMEKERKRADELDYSSPIQVNKQCTDVDYNVSLEFCLNRLENVSLVVASHNEESNFVIANVMDGKRIPRNHPRVHFSQLYGMSDNITFNLAKAGYSVSKYLPFGPIKDVIPYLMRRAQENSSVAGQTGRELSLIKKEMERRGCK